MTQIPDPPPGSGYSVFLSPAPQPAPFYRDPVILLLFLATFTLYLVSIPKTVVLEDGSIFILSGFFNGVSLPPSYPLYTLILLFLTSSRSGVSRAH